MFRRAPPVLLLLGPTLLVACSNDTLDGARSPAGTETRTRPDASHSDGATGIAVEDAGDATQFVPEGVTVAALPGGNGALEVTALTLRKGTAGTEIYAALTHRGGNPACSAAFSVELFDRSEQSVAAGIGGLLTQHYFRLSDGSATIAACIASGDVAMAAVTDLPADIVIDDVETIVYRCPYFALDVVPIDGLTITQVSQVSGRIGTAYTGVLVNGLDVALSQPAVTVFPVNRVGRPLGVATGSDAVEIPPGGRWTFQTNTVATPGVNQVAYATGALGD